MVSLLGTSGDDTLIGTPAEDTLIGFAGNDLLYGLIANDLLDGGAGSDSLFGDLGSDRLNGGDDDDTLAGSDGDDSLDGGLGGDRLDGGNGNDTYVIDNLRDRAIDSGDGMDTVLSGVSFTLGENLEVLTLLGEGNSISGTGNALSNRLTGNSGDNLLLGLAGNDTLLGGDGADTLLGDAGADVLTGGSGSDSFQFVTTARYSRAGLGVDRITDFQADDRLVLGKRTFPELAGQAGGLLPRGNFAVVRSNAAASRSRAPIVYNAASGMLFYNPNGDRRGFGSGGSFAVLDGAPSLPQSSVLLAG